MSTETDPTRTVDVRGAVDVDVHVTPASLADLGAHLDPYWQDFADDAAQRLKGLPRAYPPESPTSATSHARTISPHGVPRTPEELDTGLMARTDPAAVVLSVLTPFEAPRNPRYGTALAAACNDWLEATWLGSDARITASICINPAHPERAAEEVQRRAPQQGFVRVQMPVRTETPVGNVRYWPIYEAAEAAGVPVVLHAWGPPGNAPTPTGYTTTYLEDYLSNALVAPIQLTSLVLEGVFDRFPGLQIVLAECGFTWLPPYLWRIDKEWRGLWRETPWVKELPSSYIRRHVHTTTQPGQVPRDPDLIRRIVEIVGPETLLYASDHPHDHGDGQDRLLTALGADDRSAVLSGNARRLFGLSD